MGKRKGTRIDFYLDDLSYVKMNDFCESHGLSKSDFLRRAVISYLRLVKAYGSMQTNADVKSLNND